MSGDLCPLTGWKITRRKEWTDIQVSSGYSVTFFFIGQHILCVVPRGDSAQVDITRLYEERERVIESFYREKTFFVEIRDYTNIWGVPSSQTRRAQTLAFLREKKRGLGFIGYNAHTVINLLMRAGRALYGGPYPYELAENYEEAITIAKRLLVNRHVSSLAAFELLPVYNFEGNGMRIEVRIWEQKLLFMKLSGAFNEGVLTEALQFIKDHSKELNEGKIVRIYDYASLKNLSHVLKMTWDKELLKFFQNWQSYGLNVFIGGSRIVKNAFRAFSFSLATTRSHFSPDFHEALKHLQTLDFDNLQNAHFPHKLYSTSMVKRLFQRIIRPFVLERHLEELNSRLGHFSWAQKSYDGFNVAPDHPLKELYDSLEILQMDLHSVLQGYKQREDQLRDTRKQLSMSNRELTTALDQANRFAARAQESDIAKSRFLATMSHEIRTPMNAIIGMSEVLRTELEKLPQYSESQELAEIIHSSAHSLLEILNSVLDYSKIESGGLDLYEEPFDIQSELNRIVDLFRIPVREQGLQLELICDSSLSEIYVSDPLRIRQVLQNLMGNAVKFTQKGKVTLQVKALQQEKNIHRVRFSVSDTGIGIRKEDQARIFDRFQQADQSATRKYEGTGLGLSISRELVHKLGGKLLLESEPGQGSEFFFDLELQVGDKNTSPIPRSLDISLISKPLIAIADSDLMVRMQIRRFLRELVPDSKIQDCENGKALQEFCENRTPDLVFLDCFLDHGKGWEISASMRHQGLTFPIVALSHDSKAELRERCFHSGVQDFILKPVRNFEIRSVVERYLSN